MLEVDFRFDPHGRGSSQRVSLNISRCENHSKRYGIYDGANSIPIELAAAQQSNESFKRNFNVHENAAPRLLIGIRNSTTNSRMFDWRCSSKLDRVVYLCKLQNQSTMKE